MTRDSWEASLDRELKRLEGDGCLRRLRTARGAGPYLEVEGRRLVNLASNDYLGMSQHPRVKAAAARATEAWGTGSGASRLISGTLEAHERVERRFAQLKGAEAGLLFATGYMANLGVMTALAQRGHLVVMDKLCHASLIDGARASGAEVRVYPHLDVGKAKRLLSRDGYERRFLLTDSVFSMDGDVADLAALAEIAEETGATLIIDEAHATGVLGPSGAGLAEVQGVLGRGQVTISTASKALGGLGGIVTGPRTVIEYLVNFARPFIYSTAAAPAQVAAMDAALDVVRDESWRRERLSEMSRRVRRELLERGWLAEKAMAEPVTPILALVFGQPVAAVEASRRLWEAGYWVPAIRPPTVAPGSSRLRVSLRADLEDKDANGLVEALEHCRELIGDGAQGRGEHNRVVRGAGQR